MSEIVAFVYRITNQLNGMQYIGVSKHPKRRFREHARPMLKTTSVIKNAIHKNGLDNFSLEIICQAPQTYCYELESKIVQELNTIAPNGYNICAGGRGAIGLPGELNGMYGRKGPLSPQYGKPGPHTGKKMSEETKAKMRAARLGKKRSPEICAKMKEISLNRSPELLERMRIARAAALRKLAEQKRKTDQ
jgi:group I intron endonuclease